MGDKNGQQWPAEWWKQKLNTWKVEDEQKRNIWLKVRDHD